MDHGLRRSALAERLGDARARRADRHPPAERPLPHGLHGLERRRSLVAADGSAVFLTDGRYDGAVRHEVPDLPRDRVPRRLRATAAWMRLRDAGRLASSGSSAGRHVRGVGAAARARSTGSSSSPTETRSSAFGGRRTAEEIALIDRAQGFADQAFETVVLNGGLGEGVTERQLALELEGAMRQRRRRRPRVRHDRGVRRARRRAAPPPDRPRAGAGRRGQAGLRRARRTDTTPT